jgi:hypothetical protein
MQTFKHMFLSATAVMLALTLCGTAGAVEEQQVPPPPSPIAPENPAQAIPDKVSVSSLDQDWVIDDLGRRDPFTFTKNVVVMDPVQGGSIDQGQETPTGLPPEVLERKRTAAELACNLAEMSLMELDPNGAVAKCDQGMEEFKDVPNMSKYPELEIVKGRLLRARKASENLRGRQTAQRDFDAMNIKILGVVAKPKNSQVIIQSGKEADILHKGSMVKTSNDSTDVMVDEILPERVVFNFRGYRMMLLLQDAGGK